MTMDRDPRTNRKILRVSSVGAASLVNSRGEPRVNVEFDVIDGDNFVIQLDPEEAAAFAKHIAEAVECSHADACLYRFAEEKVRKGAGPALVAEFRDYRTRRNSRA